MPPCWDMSDYCALVVCRRFRLDGGSRSSLTVGCGGVPGVLPGLGTLGNGQVVSLSPWGQKGQILSYMYQQKMATPLDRVTTS